MFQKRKAAPRLVKSPYCYLCIVNTVLQQVDQYHCRKCGLTICDTHKERVYGDDSKCHTVCTRCNIQNNYRPCTTETLGSLIRAAVRPYIKPATPILTTVIGRMKFDNNNCNKAGVPIDGIRSSSQTSNVIVPTRDTWILSSALGSGAFGTVYKASKSDQTCAYKRMCVKEADETDSNKIKDNITEIQTELNILMMLGETRNRHENLLMCIDYVSTPQVIAFARQPHTSVDQFAKNICEHLRDEECSVGIVTQLCELGEMADIRRDLGFNESDFYAKQRENEQQLAQALEGQRQLAQSIKDGRASNVEQLQSWWDGKVKQQTKLKKLLLKLQSQVQSILTMQRFWEEQPISIMLQIAKGVGHLHKLGIIHRDLKPENIFMKSNGTPIIGDFGLSRMKQDNDEYNEEERESNMTTNIGSPGYLAPEIINPQGSKGCYNNKVDVYSLSVTFWSLLYKHAPYEAEDKDPRDTLLKRLQRIKSAEYRPNSSHEAKAFHIMTSVDWMKSRLDAIIHTGWATLPIKRYSIEKLCEELQKLLTDSTDILNKIIRLEEFQFGRTQVGSVRQRLEELECTIIRDISTGDMLPRVDKLMVQTKLHRNTQRQEQG